MGPRQGEARRRLPRASGFLKEVGPHMNPPRRLLLIAERFPPDLGGVARSAERTALALGGLGLEVHVLAWTRSRPAGSVETFRDDSPFAPVVHRIGLFAHLDMSLQH